MKQLWGNAVWPLWLAAAVTTFLIMEVYALCTDPQNTLSWWVWRTLRITARTSPANWSAADFLTFGCWMVLVTWLTFHFFFRRFT